jgi:hypothetical protein
VASYVALSNRHGHSTTGTAPWPFRRHFRDSHSQDRARRRASYFSPAALPLHSCPYVKGGCHKAMAICRATIQTYSPRRAGYLNGASPTSSLLRSASKSTPPPNTTTSCDVMPKACALRPPTLHDIGTVIAAGRMKGTRRAHANTRTTAARGLQAPPRTPALVSSAWMWLKITCTNPRGHLCGTAHAPRLPRSTPPIKRAHASYISTHSPHWPTCEKNQTCGCGTARLQYPSNSTGTARNEVCCVPPT